MTLIDGPEKKKQKHIKFNKRQFTNDKKFIQSLSDILLRNNSIMF